MSFDKLLVIDVRRVLEALNPIEVHDDLGKVASEFINPLLDVDTQNGFILEYAYIELHKVQKACNLCPCSTIQSTTFKLYRSHNE